MRKNGFILFFTLAVVSAVFGQGGKTIDEIVGVVGDEIILYSDIQIQKNQLKQQGYFDKVSDCDILEQLLLEKLLLNQAKLDSIEVTDDMVNLELEKRLQVFINQIGSQEKLEAYYGKTMEEIREDFFNVLKDQILVQRMQGEIASGLNVTPQDVKDFYNSIPADSLPFINASVEMAQIVKYPEVSVSETERVRNRLRQFKKAVEAGEEDFETLAALYSEDPGSASKGGSLGMKPRGTWVPEFDAVAFKLKNGEVSAPFKTDYGWHILQLVERRGEMYNANHILLVPKTTAAQLTRAETELDSIRNLIVRDSVSFPLAASKYSDDERSKNQNGMIVNVGQGTTIFEMNELDPGLFLAIDTLEVGEISGAFYFENQNREKGYRIVKLISKTKPHRANLVEDYQILQQMASQKLQSEHMDDWVLHHLQRTYVKLNKDFADCDFQYPWSEPKEKMSGLN